MDNFVFDLLIKCTALLLSFHVSKIPVASWESGACSISKDEPVPMKFEEGEQF